MDKEPKPLDAQKEVHPLTAHWRKGLQLHVGDVVAIERFRFQLYLLERWTDNAILKANASKTEDRQRELLRDLALRKELLTAWYGKPEEPSMRSAYGALLDQRDALTSEEIQEQGRLTHVTISKSLEELDRLLQQVEDLKLKMEAQTH